MTNDRIGSIDLKTWHELAEEGRRLPLRILIHGVSMYPLIRMDRDYVTIVPLTEPPKVGDIVLFADAERGRYVLHRLWRLSGEKAETWGDNCDASDGFMPLGNIWGRVELIERGGRRIVPDAAKGLRLARFWHVAGRYLRRLRGIARAVYRRLKRS